MWIEVNKLISYWDNTPEEFLPTTINPKYIICYEPYKEEKKEINSIISLSEEKEIHCKETYEEIKQKIKEAEPRNEPMIIHHKDAKIITESL